MIIGDQKNLAMELIDGPVGFCGLRLWIAGQGFGEPELYAPLATIRCQSDWFRSQTNLRVSPDLFSEPASVVLVQTHDAIFGEADSLEQAATAAERYSAFILSPNFCESLDGLVVVVVSDGGYQRVIVREDSQAQIHEVLVADGTLESLLAGLPTDSGSLATN